MRPKTQRQRKNTALRRQPQKKTVKEATAKSVLKRPAANGHSSSGAEAGTDAVATTYQKMWYKHSGAWGVRAKGGKQLFQVILKGHSKDQAGAFVDKCIAKLARGTSLPHVLAFVAQHKAKNKDARDADERAAAQTAEEGEEEEDEAEGNEEAEDEAEEVKEPDDAVGEELWNTAFACATGCDAKAALKAKAVDLN